MSDMMKPPLVSIIMPAHNASKSIRDALDCLVFQTLEDIEIIIVENGSTDNTLEIANEYKEYFPEKIVVLSFEWGSVGKARNVGFENARAEYIYCCDADDLVSYQAIEKLYDKAVTGKYDLVMIPYFLHRDGKKKAVSRLHTKKNLLANEYAIKHNQLTFWSKLIKKTLWERVGEIPDITFEDVAFLLPLVSYAQRIGYVDDPLYHYYRHEGTITGTALSYHLTDVLKSERFAIERCNPRYCEAVVARVVERIRYNIRTRWFMLDEIVPWIRELWNKIEANRYVNETSWRTDYLRKFVDLSTEPMPCIVYVNGFRGDVDENFIEHIKQRAFRTLEAVVILNETTCNIDENRTIREAYRDNNMELIGHYFALKKIFETGGIYLDPHIEIHASFNYMRYWGAFFGFIDKNTFSDWVFGGCAKNNVFRHILNTYDEGGCYEDRFMPLCDRIRNILFAVYEVQECRTEPLKFKDGLAVFSPDVLVVQATELVGDEPALHICSHIFSEHGENEDYIVLKRDTLTWLAQRPNEEQESQIKSQASKINSLERDIAKLENSRSWRMTAPLRRLSKAKVGSLMKQVYRKTKKMLHKP